MNRLIALLQMENECSLVHLKRLYRTLTKTTHPDLVRGSGESFLELRRDYEEAVALLQEQESIERSAAFPEKDEDVRNQLIRTLYLYAVRFYGGDSQKILIHLVALAARYNPKVHDVLTAYYRSVFAEFDFWHRDGSVYYTHNLFIAAVKQLIYYYSYSLDRQRRLLLAYLEDLRMRSQGLDATKAEILRILADWLEQEAAAERVQILWE